MPDDLTILVPRKSLVDERWNQIQAYTRTRMGDTPYVTGFDPTPEPFFSMSRAINAARKQASTPKLLITPCDYIFPEGILEQVSAELDNRPWWGPFRRVHRFPHGVTQRILRGELEPSLDLPGTKTGACMAVIAVRTDVFDDVKGMDPRFSGYAPEDYALRLKLRILHGGPLKPQPELPMELHTDRSAMVNYETTGPFFDKTYRPARSQYLMRRLVNNQPDI